jgi:hypothetical protein
MAGDESALPEVRAIVRDPRYLQAFGDLAWRARFALLNEAAGQDLMVREAVPEKLEALRQELAGPDPSPLEALLVDRILNTWLHLRALELRRGAGADLGPSAAAHHERAWDGAHRRFLAALKALAVVRKLALPVLQFNVAHNQLNVGAAGAVAAPTEPAAAPRPIPPAIRDGGPPPPARGRRRPAK